MATGIYTLTDWSIQVRPPMGCVRYTAPELSHLVVAGAVTGNPRFTDGDIIESSAVTEADGRFVNTASRSSYQLVGEPDSQFIQWAAKNNVALDFTAPIEQWIGSSSC